MTTVFNIDADVDAARNARRLDDLARDSAGAQDRRAANHRASLVPVRRQANQAVAEWS
ncbi:hypothetical protein ACHMW7_09885 [Aminobacter sp. UC22_36]|uniref:hypothetical protein n=1 Tax=Aminobacter sp. UC22_36 TaxID=3374549 RepID=UPI00375722EE